MSCGKIQCGRCERWVEPKFTLGLVTHHKRLCFHCYGNEIKIQNMVKAHHIAQFPKCVPDKRRG